MSSKQDARKKIENTPAEESKPEKKQTRKDRIKELVEEIKKEYGFDVEPKKNSKYRLLKVGEFLQENYNFRFNVFTMKPEIKPKINSNGFVALDQRSFDNYWNEVKIDANISISKTEFESLIGSDKISPSYNPIDDFIFSLPKWDGKDRFPDFLKQVQLQNGEDERPKLIKYFTKWFVAMVASLIDDHIINELALVFTGKQGRGKTRFFNSLVPQKLRLMYLYNGSFNPHDKDHKEMLGTKILINLDEMATLTRTDVESLKSAMSERYVVLRRAYGRAPIHLFRKASFCGSHNDDKFLTDQTGNRRWLPFAIHDIDVDEEFDITLLYAQALELWRNRSIKIWLDKQEIDEFEEYNEQFRFVPMEEELILANYRKPTREEIALGSGVEYLTTSEIIHALASEDKYKKMNVNDTVLKRTGKALRALGFEKIPKRFPDLKHPRLVWILKKVSSDDLKEINPATGDKDLF